MLGPSPSPRGRAESAKPNRGGETAADTARRVEARRAPAAQGRPSTELPVEIARTLRGRMTPQEAKLWVGLRKLRPAGYHFRRQVPVGRAVVNFACLKQRLIVEVDGGQHARDEHVANDRTRDALLMAAGFAVLRFWNADVDRDLRRVMDTIVARLETACPHPGPPLRSGSALPSGEGEPASLSGSSNT